jgi:phospholipid transport system substrate-binding protein
MLKRRLLFIFSLGIMTILVSASLLPTIVKAENFENGAKRFIESLADDALRSLTIQERPREERVVEFRKLLHVYFAHKTIAAWVLGRYWRRATNQQKKEYFSLFEELLVETYVDRFANYPGASLLVSDALGIGGSDVVVSSMLNRSDGQPPVKVDWRLRAREGKYKIIDLIVEGLSMGQTQRSEFVSVIRQNGGAVEGLLAELRKKIKHMKKPS